MSVVLDTNVAIDYIRGSSPALDFIVSLPRTPACSEITRIEILRGMRSSERLMTERFFLNVHWFGVDESIARRAGELGRIYRRSHVGIGAPDLVIAATAQELDLKVATLNVKHFPMFPGLKPPYRS
ncbi:MAG: PIN domain-containing protein [Actinomycetota bacterium]